jgi:hypothetical protein
MNAPFTLTAGAHSRSRDFRIFPVSLFGISATIAIRCGYL